MEVWQSFKGKHHALLHTKNLGMENDMKSKEEAIRGAKVEDGIKRQRDLSIKVHYSHA